MEKYLFQFLSIALVAALPLSILMANLEVLNFEHTYSLIFGYETTLESCIFYTPLLGNVIAFFAFKDEQETTIELEDHLILTHE